jgi:GNAT superfamily N-acetyltransferase
MTDREELRARYDREMRLDPDLFEGVSVERSGSVVRIVGRENMVLYSALDETTAAAAVAEQARYFRARGVEVEWKYFGHDRPANLETLLAAAGFEPEEPETLVVYDLENGLPSGAAPRGLEIVPVRTREELEEVRRASRAAFGDDPSDSAERWVALWKDPTQVIYGAYLDGRPVASGRLTLPPRRSFAGLYGGGTAPEFRHRGIYRALVRARAEAARERGYRYLTVDARETSRPILERLGFAPLTTTRPWVLRPAPSA